MKTGRNKLKLYLNGLFVALTCPCHAPFYVFLLSGTSLGALLAENEILFLVVLGLIFPFFIFMVVKSYHQLKNQQAQNKPNEAPAAYCKTCAPKR